MPDARTALVVGGDPPMRKLLAIYCEKSGYETTVAETCTEALEHAKSTSYCLIVTSYQLPKMNGIEFCWQLRSDQRYKSTPMLLVTAMADRLCKDSLLQELSVRLMPKPLDIPTLVEFLTDSLKPMGLDPA